ncbi:hypothetical protein [Streptomyces caatingaensis]|nr:hypothetical protein [Streptomyces caatingaensis]
MRVVVLGEFRSDRVVPVLRSGGADVVVLGFADPSALLGDGVVCGRLPEDVREEPLLRLLDGLGADVVVANPGCPGQEQFLPVYASVAARWREAGGAAPVHPAGFAALASDKVVLHRVAGERGWPVPRGAGLRRTAGGAPGRGGAGAAGAGEGGAQRVPRRAPLRAG